MTAENEKNTAEEKKVGVYICHCGGNISDHVDVHKLAKALEGTPGVVVTHTNMFMCSDPGQELIQEDIKSGRINRVVVASCAPSLHELTFRNAIKRADMNPYLYEHANIREQVSWVHHGDKATEKATQLVAAAIAKAKVLEPLEPIRVEALKHATVIGGGVAGMRAALDLSRRGIRVALLEKSPYLGGQTARLNRLYPTNDTAENVIRTLGDAVFADAGITVYGSTEVAGYEGYVGNFRLTLKTAADSSSHGNASIDHQAGAWAPFTGMFIGAGGQGAPQFIETGAIVFATGFRSYQPREGEYGYLCFAEVVTLPEFIRMTAQAPTQKKTLTINGRTIRRVAFIHCVGSRQIPGIHEPDADDHLNEYCSRTCCSAILQSAGEIRRRFPETAVFDYYRDIRTYGRGQEDYYERASTDNVLFFRYEPEAPPQVERAGNGPFPLRIRVKDTLTFGEELTAEVDLVVLGVGMEARPIGDLVDMMKLPTGQDRFLQEVHPKLRPVEVANTGILLAGTCQAPMDIGEACAAAQAAAAKAATLLTKGHVELDPYVARVDAARCTGHGRCADVCPVEGAVAVAEGKAAINPALCTGCGICVGECPEAAIDINGWTLRQYEDMVDAIVAV
ncbi:MAG: CoB--CoM heterodisulfide reductase iron-sulfur subunit A family protein [Pseudomonadota bacterium]